MEVAKNGVLFWRRSVLTTLRTILLPLDIYTPGFGVGRKLIKFTPQSQFKKKKPQGLPRDLPKSALPASFHVRPVEKSVQG